MASTTVLQLLQLSVLARVVHPAEFGLMAVVVSVTSVMALFSDAGLSRALVYFDTPGRSVLSSLFWVNVAIGVFLMLAMAAASIATGNLFGSPRLAQAMLLASISFPLNSAGQQFRAIAQKRLDFRPLAQIEIAASLAGSAWAVATALMGWQVFALVSGLLVSSATNSALSAIMLARGMRPSLRFRFSEALPYLRYGMYLTGESLFSVLRQQADVFIGSLAVGAGAIAHYSLPRDFNQRISLSINSIVTRVGFPVMARVKADAGELGRIYLGVIRITSSINFPIYIAVAIFAADFVAVLYGPRWGDAVVFMRIMAAWGMARSLANPMGSLVYAVGMARRIFWWNVVLLALFVPAIAVSVRYHQLTGLSTAVFLFQLGTVLPAWRYLIYPSCGIRLRPYLAAIARPLLLSSGACGLAWLLTRSLEPGPYRLLAAASIGGTAYLLLCLRFNSEFVAGVRKLLQPSEPDGG